MLKLNKANIRKISIFVSFIAVAILYYASNIEPEPVDVIYGELDSLPSIDKVEEINPITIDSQFEETVTKINEPRVVEIPKFNYLVELGRVIQNVRNKPEALLEAQYSAAIDRMQDRVRLAELVAQESAAKVEAADSKKQLKNINGDVTSKAIDKPKSDVDPLLTSNELLDYNYLPNDFSLKNVGPSVNGKEAIIEYRGEYYQARVGQEIVALVIAKEILDDRVVLQTPNGKFTITRRL